MKKILVGLMLLLPFSVMSSELVFEGYPSKKITINESSFNKSDMSDETVNEFKVIIERDKDRYYWKTRNNEEVIPITSGVFVTYIAKSGAGYVRTIAPWARSVFNNLNEREGSAPSIYFEHLVYLAGSITYYGTERINNWDEK